MLANSATSQSLSVLWNGVSWVSMLPFHTENPVAALRPLKLRDGIQDDVGRVKITERE